MVIEDLLQADDKSTVMRALLLRHRHVNESGGFHFPRRKFSSYTSLQVINGTHTLFFLFTGRRPRTSAVNRAIESLQIIQLNRLLTHSFSIHMSFLIVVFTCYLVPMPISFSLSLLFPLPFEYPVLLMSLTFPQLNDV